LLSELENQTRYNDRIFAELELVKGTVSSSQFFDCEFRSCKLAESSLQNCRFVNCTFRESDLSLTRWPGSVFSGARFEASRLIGIDWTQADWGKTGLGLPIGIDNCVINHSTFIGLDLAGIFIKDSTALNVDFREANLAKCNFAGTDLKDSLFHNTNLTEADLSRARNYNIAPDQNIVKKTRFSLPEAMSLLFNLDIVMIEQDDI
jgi:uncharacterized protein YjbI with pentapeptide repeats